MFFSFLQTTYLFCLASLTLAALIVPFLPLCGTTSLIAFQLQQCYLFFVETSGQVPINNTKASHNEKVIKEQLDELEKGLIFKVLSQSSNFSPRKLEGQRFHKGKRYQRFSCRGGGSRTSGLEECFCKITACSTETRTSERIWNLRDFKRQPTKTTTEGLVHTSATFQPQREGGCSHSLLSHCNKSQKVIHEPQPSAPNLYPASAAV